MKKFCLLTIVCALFLLPGCTKRPPDDDERLKKGIIIDGLNVSAMTVAEARQALVAHAEERFQNRSVTLILPEEEVTLPHHALGARIDAEPALAKAALLRSRGGERSLRTVLTIDRAVFDDALRTFQSARERPAEDASLTIDKSLATPVVYRPEQAGLSIDLDALTALVAEALQNETDARIVVPCTILAPGTTEASLRNESALVARFSTSFGSRSLSAENRVFNMQKAADIINGMVLAPGESFDCNAVLGDRTEENGWKTAPGIRNGRYEDEYGGGVCQVSSTLFNAVLMADLTVTERSPHSWPMGYVDIGRDATISTGGKNFCFINDSGAPIRLFTHVDTEEKVLTASLYGKPLPDGRYIEITSENTGTLETAGEIFMLDESLPYRTENVEREARDGKTSVTYKNYYTADGALLRREIVYEDTYRAIDGLTYLSTDMYYGEGNETNEPDTSGEPSQ